MAQRTKGVFQCCILILIILIIIFMIVCFFCVTMLPVYHPLSI